MKNKVVIAGSGAMGLTFGYKLSTLEENEVYFVDTWAENVKKLNEDGLTIFDIDKTVNKKVAAYLPEDFKEKVDLVVVFVKSMKLVEMLESIKKNIKEDTKVLCLLNGLGHIDTLKKYFKKENIIVGVSLMTAGMNGPAHAKCTSYGYNEISSIEIADLITRAGLDTRYTKDVLNSIWVKACLNGMYNSICTILDTYLGELRDVEGLDETIHNIIEEFHSVGLKEGVDFNKEEALKKLRACVTKGYPGEFHYPSMHQDLRTNHRKTEIDYLNGYISRKAKEYGISTPYCDLITFQIKELEKKLAK